MYAYGAKASADIYSIVETAKANSLDVLKYFELLLTVLPSMEFLTNSDILEELLPWNSAVQKNMQDLIKLVIPQLRFGNLLF